MKPMPVPSTLPALAPLPSGTAEKVSGMSLRARGVVAFAGATKVLGVRDGFKMVRSGASDVAAQVVDLATVRDGTDVVLVTDAVEEEHHFRCVLSAESDVQCTVASSDGTSTVVPASVFVLDGRVQNPALSCCNSAFGRWVRDEAGHDTYDTGGPSW